MKPRPKKTKQTPQPATEDRPGALADRGIGAVNVEAKGRPVNDGEILNNLGDAFDKADPPTRPVPPVVVGKQDPDGYVRLRLILDRVDPESWRQIEERDPHAPRDVKVHKLLWALVDEWLLRRLDSRGPAAGPTLIIRMQVGDGPLEPVIELDKAAIAASGVEPERKVAEALRDLAEELDYQSGAYDAEGAGIAADAEEGDGG